MLVLLSLATLGTGCPPKSQRPAPVDAGEDRSSPVDDVEVAPVPVDRGQPARELRGGDLGVVLTLPRGWTALLVEGEGDVVARAFGPARTGVGLELFRWDGREESVADVLDVDPWSWRAEGPYAVIEGADGPPLVATFREVTGRDSSRDQIGFAWFFTVEGRGVGLIARVPAARMEAGFVAARGVVVSARAEGL